MVDETWAILKNYINSLSKSHRFKNVGIINERSFILRHLLHNAVYPHFKCKSNDGSDKAIRIYDR